MGVFMKWVKKGLIFKPSQNYKWMKSHASIPVVDSLGNGALRIYFSTRDEMGRSHPTYIEVNETNPSQVVYIHNNTILNFGKLGTFDDNGIMPSWIVNYNGLKYLYYIGWNPQVTVPYRLAIGLAISNDGGKTFNKYSNGPICDRDIQEPFFNTAPCVLKSDDVWRMWYVSCTGWKLINHRQEPMYNVKYAESKDGINWTKKGCVCIDYDDFSQAIGRPCVYIKDGKFRMLYSFRSINNYRTDPIKSYRLGYAESVDGKKMD